MNFETCIRERRSTRKFSEQEVSDEVLKEITDLARFSPSWKNTQAIRYYAVRNSHLKEQLAEHCTMNFAFNTKTIQRCNVLILVSIVEQLSGYEEDGSFSTSKENQWEMFDAGIASQTFCLAAHSKGVGSVILGIFDENKIREYIQLPSNEHVAALIALGYPADPAKPAPARKNVEELLTIIE